jgi:2'-5' RNA ligase
MITRKRLFFALWPDDLTRQKCTHVTQGINKRAFCLVTPANLHVTLLFLGYVSAEQEQEIRQEAATIVVPKIAICFNQLSYWKKPGVLCLTSTENSPDAIRLVSDLTIAAKKLDIVIDDRPYKPHVTLAKKAKGSWVKEFEPINWFAMSFCLVESIAHADGSEYRIIGQWDLQQNPIPDS